MLSEESDGERAAEPKFREGGGGGGGGLKAGDIPSSTNLVFAMGALEYLSRVSWNLVTLALLTCEALSLMDATRRSEGLRTISMRNTKCNSRVPLKGILLCVSTKL